MFASVTITASAAKKLKAGYPWVFERDILSRRFDVSGIVAVQDKRGRFLGQAFYSPRSKIVLRFITKSKAAIGKEFWRKRVLDAFERRLNNFSIPHLKKGGVKPRWGHAPLRGEGGFAVRVVYAESDGIPSVIIDKYNDIFAIQITSAGAETIKGELIDIIIEEFKPAAVIEKNNVEVRKIEGLPLIEKVVYGDKTTTVIHEGSQKFEVDVLHGQKTGAYLDYRAFRLKAAELSFPPPIKPFGGKLQRESLLCNLDPRFRGDDKPTILDLFCYQGWFACQIAKSYDKVIAVDASHNAINAAKRNAELNNISLCHPRPRLNHSGVNSSGDPVSTRDPRFRGDGGCIEFICKDVFEFLATCKDKFDFIHLDPPPFAKGRAELPTAIKGYKKLNLAALKLLKPGGILFTSSCSHHISENMLERIIREAAEFQGFKFQVIYRGIQDKDHPVLKGFPESLYLKAIAGFLP